MTDLSKIILGKVLNQPVNKNQNRQLFETLGSSLMIIFELEGYVAFLKLYNSAFGDHRAFGVPTCISDSLACTFQGRTDENMPTFLTDMSQQLVNIDTPPSVFSKPTSKQRISFMSFSHRGNDVQLPLSSKKWRRDKISFRCPYPALSIKAQPSRCDYYMQMDIPLNVVSEGMQYNDETGLIRFLPLSAFEPFEAVTTLWQGLSHRQTQKSICSRPKQYVQKNSAVVFEEQTKLPGKGEDQMPVRHIQNIREQLLTPLVSSYFATTRAADRFATVRDNLNRITFGA